MKKRNDIWRIVKEYGLIHLGAVIYAFSWAGIVLPAGGIGGGSSGIALLLQYSTGLPMGIGFIAVNAVLVAVATLVVGWKFGAKTIWGIGSIALWLNVFQAVVPPGLLGLADDKLLSALLAGAIAGMGVGLCFLQGGSTGGVDIIAMIVNKFRRVAYGRVVVVVDFFVIGSSYFIYSNNPSVDNPIAMIIYGYVMLAVTGYTIDLVMSGEKQSSQIFIFSRHHERITEAITHKLDRGVTILDGTGGYTGRPSKMLIVMCRKVESPNILRAVREIDPEAFVSVAPVMGVYGEGFDSFEIKTKKGKKK